VSFHEGELLVQKRAGVLDDARRVGQMLRRAIPPGARVFLADRRFIVLSAATPAGPLWVSVLAGPPGFLAVSDDGTLLEVRAQPQLTDPIAPAIVGENSIGLIAIDFAARRRYRVNGTVTSVAAGITLEVHEAFGNCPKYIQAQTPRPDAAMAPSDPRSADRLDEGQRGWIERAETLFLGTLHPEAGADASHRGGAPGFVRVTGPREIVWGDYPGNTLFNSLGNAAVHPAAGLLFLDPQTGSTLQLSGTLEIDWSPEAAAAIPGAERVVRFSVQEVIERPGAIPLRWDPGEPSPANPPAR